MLQKAIIESIENNYQVKVRIPKFDRMAYDGTVYGDLSTSIVCTYPGTLVNYSVGDVVLVGFENDEINKPVVLGLLYTENNVGESITIPAISDALSTLNNSVSNLTNKQSYIHIKYSNDNGITFTSLYDYSDVEYKEEEDDGTDVGAYIGKVSDVDSKSTYIAWNIVDMDNANALDNFLIYTTVWGDEDVDNSVTYDTKVIELPSNFNGYSSLTISYRMGVIDGELSDYNIALYTDRNPLGSVVGDYIGVNYSSSATASANPIDYSWASIKTRIQKFIDEAYDSLLKRVQTNERYLYGESKEDTENTNRGLNSALYVSENELDISFKQNVNLSKNTSISLNTQNNFLYFNNITLVARNNGHFSIQYKEKNK